MKNYFLIGILIAMQAVSIIAWLIAILFMLAAVFYFFDFKVAMLCSVLLMFGSLVLHFVCVEYEYWLFSNDIEIGRKK